MKTQKIAARFRKAGSSVCGGAIINAPQEVCVERARYLTRAMKENWDRHPLTRMSMALEHILHNISVIIREDELIVGCRTSKLKGAPLFPENKSKWIEGDLDNFDTRVLQCALIPEEEKESCSENTPPFWRAKTVEDRLEELLPADVAERHGQVHLHHDAGDHLRHRPFHHEPPEGAGAGPRGHHPRGRGEAPGVSPSGDRDRGKRALL